MTSALGSDHVIDERTLHGLSCLERKADSGTVTIFLHGLGLDATDYLDYLRRHDSHSIALTLRGYEPDGVRGLPPVPLSSHIRMVAGAVAEVRRENARKRIVIAGFSLGADLVLQLAEHWRSEQRTAPPVHAAVLLDPNVNQSTMSISRLFADADPRHPLPVFKQLIASAADEGEFRALCRYLPKLAPKDFGQISQLSRDMLSYWNPSGYEQLTERLGHVARVADQVRIVLSAPYDEHLPAIEAAMRQYGGTDHISAELTKLDHFGLIGEESLARTLAPFAG
ncbi:alpha/beta hydrolase [Streptomyces sp. MP131-18]|uniref:alpha/beta fold hydrolase n=1 Tax=Streptomyces sp. MP131-18 TaxID=1857892 RepID=UPI0009D2D9A2|nr:alpha/beta hydrolase [Streptomyces sp. MP131-18]ONK13792.1 Esterase/lipase [Streptomyces sp. MP131-18]